jgi:hypothetical protein
LSFIKESFAHLQFNFFSGKLDKRGKISGPLSYSKKPGANLFSP